MLVLSQKTCTHSHIVEKRGSISLTYDCRIRNVNAVCNVHWVCVRRMLKSISIVSYLSWSMIAKDNSLAQFYNSTLTIDCSWSQL